MIKAFGLFTKKKAAHFWQPFNYLVLSFISRNLSPWFRELQ